MNLCRLLNWVCIWCASFEMSNAATPLPPNTGMTLVADVAGTTLANDAYWADKCKMIPPTALFIVVQMGNVTDFFKPINSETSFCEMLQSHNKHQWSPDGIDWVKIDSISDSIKHNDNGGSAGWWPRDKGLEEDKRAYLSVWGHDGGVMGGCCSSSTVLGYTYPSIPGNGVQTHWGQSFTLSYAIALQPLPPNTGMTLVADVPGTTLTNDAFWAEQCKTIPSNALFVVVDMGAVRDFFKPVDGTTTFCEMLQAHNTHQWSPNGVEWFAVEFDGISKNNGGSASWWPRNKGVEGEARMHLSFWGDDYGGTGGCCSTSTAVATTGDFWGESFTLSYALPLNPPPPNIGMSLVADVPGTTLANDAYWAEKCKTIPSIALFIVVDMGAVRDFYKPIDGATTFCEMLQAHNKHQWSANGVDWFEIEFTAYEHSNKGGSAGGWLPIEGLQEDKRIYRSFWGNDLGMIGGCCSSSTAVTETHPSLPGQPTHWGQPFTMSYGFYLVEAYARLLAENRLLNNTVAVLSDNLTTEQDNLATERTKVAAVSQNLTTCNIKLEQRRLARLAQAEEDLANHQTTTGGTNSDSDGNSTPSPNGAVAGGVVAGLVVIGIIVFILHRKAGSNGVQRNQRNNAEAEELRDRGATLEMMQNPMWGQQRGAAVEGGPAANLEDVADVYYSEIAEVPNQDADGYVVYDSLAEPETPVYATYASSGAPGGAFYAAPADGDGVATYAAPLDTATAAPQPSASPPEVGGVTYSRSANSVVVPGSNTSHA